MRLRALALGIALGGVSVTGYAAASRNVLWAGLQACILAKRTTGSAFPCLSVDLGTASRPGTAVLRPPGARTHIVLMPTDHVSGLEAPELQGDRGAYFWRAALAARRVVTDALGGALPLEDVGLAVNSVGGRSQDQLHIHADCLRPGIRAAIQRRVGRIGSTWAPLRVPLEDATFVVMRVPAGDVGTFNPFAALALLPGRRDMRDTTLATIETSPGDPHPGFFILARRAIESHAERLLDHSCRTVTRPSAGE